MFIDKKRLISLSTLFLFILLIATGQSVYGKTKVYYSGDAINYNDQLVIGSINMGYGEIFTLRNNEIIKIFTIPKSDLMFSKNFYDLKFNQEDEKLFLYLVDGRCLYKYNISNLKDLILEKKEQSNVWDWFLGLNKKGDKLITISNKNVSVWNKDNQIVEQYDLKNNLPNNLNFGLSDQFIFNLKENQLEVYSPNSRNVIKTIPLNIKEEANRQIFNDGHSGNVYVVDDQYLHKFSFENNFKEVKNFKHISKFGYDVSGSFESDYLYFSDGLGIVKFDKETLKPLNWTYTTDMAGPGGWAMGLKAVKQTTGDKIVIFNASNILVLDSNLKKINAYSATEEDEIKPIESLFLNIDRNRTSINSSVALSGGGFKPLEKLIINFGGQKTDFQANEKGRFEKIIPVPNLPKTRTDIKVSGVDSGLNYSLGMQIE